MRLKLKTKMLIHQSTANFYEKIFISKIAHLEKCLYRVCMGIENSTFHSGP